MSSTGHSSSRVPAIVILLLASLLAAACDDVIPCVVTARAYEPDARCLEGYTPIGVVEADALSSRSAPTCLSVGATLYVTTVCGPYPAESTTVDSQSAACVEAVALLKANTTCQ